MGCDIHVFLERKHKDEWVMVKEVIGKARSRNYYRFVKLAGVRAYNPNETYRIPLGLPDDVSQSVSMYADIWGIDGHSHSYMPVKEFLHTCINTEPSDTYDEYYFCHRNGYKSNLDSKYLDEWLDDYVDEGSDIDDMFRIVFWFDN